jgi:hypothetical protein
MIPLAAPDKAVALEDLDDPTRDPVLVGNQFFVIANYEIFPGLPSGNVQNVFSTALNRNGDSTPGTYRPR